MIAKEEAKKIILSRCFVGKSGRFTKKANEYEWWVSNDMEELYDMIMSCGMADLRQNIFHFLNDLSDIPVCANDDCTHHSTWRPSRNSYSAYCTSSCASKSTLTKTLRKNRSMERYGTDNPAKSIEVKDKTRNTILNRYGVVSTAMIPEVKEKIRKTNLLKYGVDHPMKTDCIKNKVKDTNMLKHGVDNCKKRHYSCKTKEVIDDESWLKKIAINKNYTRIARGLGVSKYAIQSRMQKLGVKSICVGSSIEDSVNSILDKANVLKICSIRDIIPPYELDIYLPEHNIAIECNGSYWHAELQGKDKNYHINKTRLCDEQGIQLIHIWEHDWNRTPELIKQRLFTKLGKNETVYARKTIAVTLPSN
jgi:hypothetical protein